MRRTDSMSVCPWTTRKLGGGRGSFPGSVPWPWTLLRPGTNLFATQCPDCPSEKIHSAQGWDEGVANKVSRGKDLRKSPLRGQCSPSSGPQSASSSMKSLEFDFRFLASRASACGKKRGAPLSRQTQAVTFSLSVPAVLSTHSARGRLCTQAPTPPSCSPPACSAWHSRV